MTTLRATFSKAAVIVLFGLFVAGCSKSDNKTVGPGGSADVTINIAGELGASSFSPSPDTISVGQTVAWHNADSMTHTATSNAGGAFNTGNIAGGTTSHPIAMNTAGTFPYHCSIHASMSGVLVVR